MNGCRHRSLLWNSAALVLLLVLSSSVLLGCASEPRVTSPAPGGVIHVTWHDQQRLSLGGGSIERPVTTQFWLFAEDGIDFHYYDSSGPEPSELDSREWILLPSPDLRVIAYVNGLPVALHHGRVLVGTRNFGSVGEGETLEFTAAGVLVDGERRGALPE